MRLICLFDISSNKIRRQVNIQLEGYGYRIQESVYVCDLKSAELNALQTTINSVLGSSDRVHYYPLCGKDIDQSVAVGSAQKIDIPDYYFL